MMREYEIRYLKYWWDRKSIIDPTNVDYKFHAVFYDHKGRRIKVVTYGKDGEITHYHCISWKGSWPTQIKRYSSDNDLQYTTTYHYNKLGFLVDERVFSKDGTFLGSMFSHERDIIDSLNQWLSDLIAFPVVVVTGLINYTKRLFVNRKEIGSRRSELTNKIVK
jgi:hypothetical protein